MPSHFLPLLLAAPPFTRPNPVSHWVWWVAAGLGLLVVIIVGVDAVDWVREQISRRRRDSGETKERTPDLRVRRPDSEMRQRHYREPPRIGRDRRANEPAELDP